MVRSATLVASIVIWAIRLRKKAKKKIAGTDSEMPSRVMNSAVEIPSATFSGLGWSPAAVAISWKLMIMPQIVPTSPIIGPSCADDRQVADLHAPAR